MAALTLQQKLSILADAAKYDASCASSSARKKNSSRSGGIGSTEGMGICHSYAPDGRCISLLKVLLTNYCQYDCLYCVNRVSSNVRRARFRVNELIDLTLEFYRRNYIEGLFLSSGIIRSPDYTMDLLVQVARGLREDHQFRGYIHLKTIPDADPELLDAAGRYADRLSVNIELPTKRSLKALAPEKDDGRIRGSMAHLKAKIGESRRASRNRTPRKTRDPKAYNATSQSTQMIIGADDTPDSRILRTSDELYSGYRLKRVYYSAFSPTPHPSSDLPPAAPPLLREHRLYQADWLLRFYGFTVGEITAGSSDGMLDLDIDPKLAWALAHREQFPIDINRADRETLLRVPGLGTRGVMKILSSRRHRRLRIADLARLTTQHRRARPFVVASDWQPGSLLDREDLRAALTPAPRQGDLFASAG